MDHPDELLATRQRAYNYGRKMIWSDVGRRYLDTFAEAKCVSACERTCLDASWRPWGYASNGYRKSSLTICAA